jgi:hypothetical protein
VSNDAIRDAMAAFNWLAAASNSTSSDRSVASGMAATSTATSAYRSARNRATSAASPFELTSTT